MMSRLLILLLLVPALVHAQGLPLFASDETLDIVIEFPVKDVLRSAAERPVVDGTATYTDTNGAQVSLPIQVSTRGRSRLELCRFPPLSLIFKKKSAAGTVFEGQKTLKLVTHCQRSAQFRSYVVQEYGIYEAFTALTDVAFRARHLSITYRDSEKAGSEIAEHGFLIESIDEVGQRNSLERQKVRKLKVAQLDPAYATLTAMFHFLVGNTDWSNLQAPAGSNCCHNGRVLSEPGAESGWMVVPYDFDQTGIIDPRYAEPAPQLGIRTVRQRLWRGRCVHNESLDAIIAQFNARRADVEEALLQEGIRSRRSAANYIDSFYRVINDPKQRQRQIEDRCLGG